MPIYNLIFIVYYEVQGSACMCFTRVLVQITYAYVYYILLRQYILKCTCILYVDATSFRRTLLTIY